MKTPIVSKLVVLFVFSIVLQSCTADALPGDPAASPEKTVVKPTNVSAEVAGELIIPKTKG
ncbi:hypothetical protein GENT5_17100 [Flavobacterium ammoniigenes]|uniref:Uncharacterized protein n=1 Tax=Flavobacterium ammoniigenes TaxID=1751095 RepID=A0ABM7V760_9FLAO|nr:hypothetical protein [Flavobacterium ammoniigenes]BDB55405.1 hypothetical protein GENT5_17100 [Flavobacterium ammoniigenes]